MKQIVDDPVVQVVQIPQVHVVERTVEIPQLMLSRKSLRPPRLSLRAELNSVSEDRSSNPVLFHSLGRSIQCLSRPLQTLLFLSLKRLLRCLTLGREIRHSMLSTRTFNTSSTQDRIQQRAIEQTTPAIPLVEKTVEAPDTQTQDMTQHVVNTIEVERPKLAKETVQEKINQVTKHIKIPQVQFLNKVDDMLVDVQQQIRPMAQTVQKTTEIPQLQFPDQVVDVTVVVQRQVPSIEMVQKTVEVPQTQSIVKELRSQV